MAISSWIFTPVYQTFNSKIHSIPILTKAVTLFLQIMNSDIACSAEKASINIHENVIFFSVSMEMLDVYWILIFSIALSIVTLSTTRWQWRYWGKIFLVLFFYDLIRVALLLILYSNFPDFKRIQFPPRSAIFFDPFWRSVSFLPIAVFLPLIIPSPRPTENYVVNFCGRWQEILFLSSFFLFVGFCYTGTYILEDPGQKKDGRILIDDWHSGRWEPADISLGEQDFGGTPLYAYSEFVKILRSSFTSVDVNTNVALSSSLLDRYDVLILKTPVKPYSNQEIAAVQDFTQKGGGLFLIADHSDLLGMNTYFNELIPEWTARYNFDSVNRLSTGWFYEYYPDKIFKHIIMRNINKFEFLTSCSITAPLWGSEIVIPATDAISDPVDYSQRNFFGTMRLSPEHSFGCLTLCAASQVDSGRVLMFTDGTVFSSFCLYRGEHTKFALNSVDWLNRKNKWGYLPNYILGLLTYVTLFLGGMFFLRVPHIITLTFGMSSLLCGCIIGTNVFDRINMIAYKEITPHKNQNYQICFVTKGNFFRLPPV
ncbi:MAG: DUF4350 domain-containing protein, partial [Bacteroidales bacterium]|nr:DUF4350 domain-containing protein [Bacteroidales bacterium]